MPQFTAKRRVIPKFRKMNEVNYRQEDEIVNSPQSCTSLECSTNAVHIEHLEMVKLIS